MPEENKLLAASVLESIRLIAIHHGLWFAETVHQFGIEKALEAETKAGGQAVSMALSRLGFAGNPFEEMPPERLEALLGALGKLWLGLDGVWFQAVEGIEGMDGAKRVNDTCWARFAPLEAVRMKALLGLPEQGGLDALEAALRHRCNSRINEVDITREGDALFLRFVDCRVQAARRRKGLPDYPCKSAGVTEYHGFASFVDRRVVTQCLACPPDLLPEGEFCSWRFTLAGGA
jgi:hypothetical protein